jgi:gluconate 2-dehydrogenase gamma chain
LPEFSRRSFLATVSGGAAAIWLTAETRDVLAAGAHAARAAHERAPFAHLSAADARDIEAGAAQIIPSDDTPGAREAHVIYFIDSSLGTFAADQKEAFATGAKELRARAAKQRRGARSFAGLSDADQHAVMESLFNDKHPFATVLRRATLAGMFASPEHGGNFNKAGWKLLGFNDQFSWSAPFGWYDRNA